MAKEDYNTPEAQDQEAFAAAHTLEPHLSEVDRDAAQQAEDGGVVDAAFVDYDEAIQRYEARSDVETLEQRRARENGTAFSEADDLRAVGEVQGVVTTKAVEKGDAPRVNVPADDADDEK